MRSAGKDAPEPCRSTACAGVEATRPNASAIDATFANFETLIISPLGFELGLSPNKEKVLNQGESATFYWIT